MKNVCWKCLEAESNALFLLFFFFQESVGVVFAAEVVFFVADDSFVNGENAFSRLVSHFSFAVVTFHKSCLHLFAPFFFK